MSMRVLPLVAAALLGVAAAVLVACGSGDDRRELIPPRSASRLKSAIADVRAAVDDGDCDAAARALTRARGALLNLPPSVNDDLEARLEQGIDNLAAIAPRECAEQETQTDTVETTETTAPQTTPPETATTDTTETSTTPPETTTTGTAPPDTTTSPPDTTTTAPPADTSGGTTTP